MPLVAFSLLLAMLLAVMPAPRFNRSSRHPGIWVPIFSQRVVVALLLIAIQIAAPPLALAGDSGLPAIPPSDADYLIFYHGDHLGSAQLITEGKVKGRHAGITYKRGDVIQRFEYAAFGRESFALNPNLSWDPAFTGQQYDIETGLYYYRARYYNPILGRFIQPDTMVQNPLDPQSWNRYAYVRNNPLKYVDPSGNMIEIQMDWPGDEDKPTGTPIDLGTQGSDSQGNGPSPENIADGHRDAGGLVGESVSVAGPYAFGGSSAGSGAWNVANSALNLIHGFNRVMDILSAGASGFDRVALGGYAGVASGFLRGQSWWDVASATLDVAAFVGLAKLGTVGRVSTAKGTTVIGHLPDYVNVAEEMRANYLKPTPNWNWRIQSDFIKDVIERGDHACPVHFTKVVGAEGQVGGGLYEEDVREAA